MLDLILLDRDGVINANDPRCISRAEDFHLLPGTIHALRMINQAKIPVAIVTNQAGVERGYFSQEDLKQIHEKMNHLFTQESVYINAVYFCTDATVAPNFRRKPAPGMIQEALGFFKAAPCRTLLVGDSITDLQAACAAGCQRALVRTGHGTRTESSPLLNDLEPVSVFDTLLTAIQHYVL